MTSVLSIQMLAMSRSCFRFQNIFQGVNQFEIYLKQVRNNLVDTIEVSSALLFLIVFLH